MIGKGLGLKVLIGIVLGILLGLVLLRLTPVGVQPNDTLTLTTSSGEKIDVIVPESAKEAARLKSPDREIGNAVEVAGMTVNEASQVIGDALGMEVIGADIVPDADGQRSLTDRMYIDGKLFIKPEGVQPGDRLTLTAVSGETVDVLLPSSTSKPGKVTVLGKEVGRPVLVAGTPFASAADIIGPAVDIDIESIELKERKGVTVRPAITEVVYVGGEIFLRLLKMLVVPLVIVTVLVGIASLGSMKRLGRMGGMTAFIYIGTMLVAAFTGAVYVNLIQPGVPLREQWQNEAIEGAVSDRTASELILNIIPTNPIAAIAELDIIGILFFTILMAFAMLAIGKKRCAPVFNFFEAMNDIVFVLIGWVMRLAPYGVGLLIAHTIGVQDIAFLSNLIQGLLLFALTVILTLATHFCFLLLIAWKFGKYNPIEFVRRIGPALAVAFGTNSSNATLPVTMKCVEEMGVSKRIRNFVVPIGATLNMDGTAAFEAIAVIFFAQAFGIDFGFGEQFLVAILAVVAAMGAAGIPSAGLVTMVMVLSAVGLPATKIATIFAIDRPLDMLRTAVNITTDALAARIIQIRMPDIRPEDDDLASEYEEIDPEASHGS